MYQHKWKWGVMPLMAAALLVAGCTKEVETPGLRIIEKNMTGGGGNTKVAVDFSDLTHNTWVAGGVIGSEEGRYYKEYISIAQGSSSLGRKEIQESEGNYYIDYNPTGDFSAGYPTATNQQTSTSVSIPYSAEYNVLRYISSGTYAGKCIVQFPMVAFGHSGDQTVTFHHATGAIAFDIVNNATNYFQIKCIVITALDENNDSVGVWSTLTCTPSGDGICVEKSASTSSTSTFYLNNNQTTKTSSTAYCQYSLSVGNRIHVILPIPTTPKVTKFQIAIYKADYVHGKVGWYYTKGDLIIQRTTPLINIGLNEIHKLGDFYLADPE